MTYITLEPQHGRCYTSPPQTPQRQHQRSNQPQHRSHHSQSSFVPSDPSPLLQCSNVQLTSPPTSLTNHDFNTPILPTHCNPTASVQIPSRRRRSRRHSSISSLNSSPSFKHSPITIGNIKRSSRSPSSPNHWRRSSQCSVLSEQHHSDNDYDLALADDDECNYTLVKQHPLSDHFPMSASDHDVPVYNYFYHPSQSTSSSVSTLSSCSSSSSSSNSSYDSSSFMVTSTSTLALPITSTTTTTTTTTNTSDKQHSTAGFDASSLLRILNNDDHTRMTTATAAPTSIPLTPPPTPASTPPYRPSLVSNLTKSFINWKSSKVSESLTIAPRMTDDSVPLNQPPPVAPPVSILPDPLQTGSALNQQLSDLDAAPTTELQTYSTSATTQDNTMLKLPHELNFRNRDERINSKFLVLYAQDYHARAAKLLPNAYTNEEFAQLIQSPPIHRFHQQYNFYRISNMSRDKLWSGVILKPRSDPCPRSSIDFNQYAYTGDDEADEPQMKRSGSVIRLHGDVLPWTNSSSGALAQSSLRKTYKPAGLLPGVRGKINGEAPSSGVSRTQYTMKGWCNRRWLDCSP